MIVFAFHIIPEPHPGDIFIMNTEGKNLRNLTDHPANDTAPSWFDPAFALSVALADKHTTTWGWLKQLSK
jgi:hypothetical protein